MAQLAKRDVDFAKWLFKEFGGKPVSSRAHGLIPFLAPRYNKSEATIRSLINNLIETNTVIPTSGPNRSGRGRHMLTGIRFEEPLPNFLAPKSPMGETILGAKIVNRQPVAEKAIEPEPTAPAVDHQGFTSHEVPPVAVARQEWVVRKEKPVRQEVSSQAIAAKTEPVIQSEPANTAPPAKTRIAGLFIDYDNAVLCAKDAGYNVSWKKLIDYVKRNYGHPHYRKAYISLKSREDINQLWMATIEPVLCPMHIKDKDSVDEVLKNQVRAMAEDAWVEVFIIVSADGDIEKDALFQNYVEDRGKRIFFVNTGLLKQELDGGEVAKLFNEERSYTYRMMDKIVEAIENNSQARGEHLTAKGEFVKDAFRVIRKHAENRKRSFLGLLDIAWPELGYDWGKMYRKDHLKTIMSVFADRNILRREESDQLKYYRVDMNHRLSQVVAATNTPVLSH